MPAEPSPGAEPSSSGIDPPSASRKGRRYGFACTGCKARKVRCSGDQPVCLGCRRYGGDCIWPSPHRSSESQLWRDANERIRALEASLQRRPSSPSQPSAAASVAAEAGSDRVTANPDSDGQSAATTAHPATNATPARNSTNSYPRLDGRTPPQRPVAPSPVASAGTAAPTSVAARRPSTSTAAWHQPDGVSVATPAPGSGPSPSSAGSASHPSTTDNTSPSTLWNHVGIGGDGAVIYNGITSRFHAGALQHHGEDDAAGGHGAGSGDEDDNATAVDDAAAHADDASGGGCTPGREPDLGHIATLRSQYDLMDSVWIPLIAAKPMMNNTGVDTKTSMALLDIYWSWLHPLHNIVYRPVFLMDLALGGPHCSDFLLLCIFGLAARHLSSEGRQTSEAGASRGEQYVARATALLLEEMAAPVPTIPTIQGLLILGGRQCAIGRSSQGWLYTGMAIRMMQDIGLHLDTIHLVSEMERWTPAEVEVRKRIYNSAYIWDKTLSLALGRPPSLIRRPYPPGKILDKFDDQRHWQPIHATEVAQSYAPSPSWVSSTFCAFSSLHEVTTDMMLLFSTNADGGRFTDQVRSLDARFRQWYEDTPAHLKVDGSLLPDQSPPPHIISLNLLYHTLHILLRRPFFSAANQSIREAHIKTCIMHAQKIHAIHTVYSKSFPHRLMTYQVSYCVYTAATVEVLQLKQRSTSPEEREESAARLTAAVRILQNEATHTPGSGKSLDTLGRLLSECQRPKRKLPQEPRRRRVRQRGEQQGPRAQEGGNGDRVREGGDGNGNTAGGWQPPDASLPGRRTTAATASGGSVRRAGYIAAATTATQAPGTWPGSVWGPADLPAHGIHSAPDQQDSGLQGGVDWVWEDCCGSTNTGAGFHPGAFSWAATGDFPRMSPPVLSTTSATALAAYPAAWAAQDWPMPPY